nr:long-chain-fatty-acid--CoA ligase [Agromyces sp. Soil535]
MNPYATRPWFVHYAEGVPHEIDEPTQTLVDMIDDAVARFGKRTALEFFGAETSYRELGVQIARAAEGLRRLGVGAGDRVAIVLPNFPQHVVAFYAVLRLGAIVVEHNPLYTPRELRHQFEDHGARIAIVWDSVADTIADFPGDIRPAHIVAVDPTRALPLGKRMALRLPLPSARASRAALTGRPTARGILDFDRMAGGRPLAKRHPRPALGDTALLQYTSGTTGVPKGAMLSHRNLRANAMQGRAWVPGLREGREVFYAVLPLFHAYGMTLCLTIAMGLGARLVLFPTFDVDLVFEAAKHSPPTFLPAVPPIYDRLSRAAEQRGAAALRGIRFSISGAMSLPTAIADRWETVTGGLLVEGYGMTESSPLALGNPMGPTRRPGTVGVPFPSTEIRVVDPEHPTEDRPMGERGELLIRGPQVFQGYWRRPAETAESLLAGGWLRTGDIVHVADGFVTVVDRLKELIITGGFKVSPSEVEGVLLNHPDVRGAAVVGLPRPTGGEDVAAVVELRDGAVFDAEALRDFSREGLAAYKVPKRISQVDELPRSLIGKVLRRKVRDGLIEEHAAR